MNRKIVLIFVLVSCILMNNQIFSQNQSPVIENVRFEQHIDGSGTGGEFEWVSIPAGAYTWGQWDEIRTIDYNYEMMNYEVTNEQYVTYLEEALSMGTITGTSSTVDGYYEGDVYWSAGTYEFLDLDDSDCRIDYDGTNFSIISGYENHPVVDVSWFGSYGFAKHYGWKLPTEEEWEKGARGNTGWDYPWGNSIDGSRANYRNSGDPFDNGTTPIGYYNGDTHNGFATTDSPSPYGAYDMAGNVWDWCNSFYGGSGPSYRVVRSGSWYDFTNTLQCWNRDLGNPLDSYDYGGFRCARDTSDIIPVGLLFFTSEIINSEIALRWQTASETNNQGFEIYRDDSYLTFIKGRGTTTEKQTYSYLDKEVTEGMHIYRLIQVDYDGTRDELGKLQIEFIISPKNYQLSQNYPNPFNPMTTMEFSIPQRGFCDLSIFNTLGEKISTLVSKELNVGKYKFEWDAKNYPSGIYYYELNSGEFRHVKKMLLLK